MSNKNTQVFQFNQSEEITAITPISDDITFTRNLMSKEIKTNQQKKEYQKKYFQANKEKILDYRRVKRKEVVAQEWQPISKYPQDSLKSRILTDGEIVVCGWLEGVSFSGEAYYQAGGKSRIWPTHFMELPKPPVTKEKEDK